MTALNRVSLFGIAIDNLTMTEAVASVRRLLEDGSGPHYVTTLNVHHIVRLHKDRLFRQAYAGASLVVADGMPVVWMSRPLGRPLQMRVAGADLFTAVCEMAASGGRSLFLLGGLGDVAERAAQNLSARYPGLRIAGTLSPPLGFERDPVQDRRIIQHINCARPDVLAIGLGAPKQELWIAAHRLELQFRVALCIGGALDFAAGAVARAPRWMQDRGLEWLWRLTQEPRRLWRRYLVEDLAFAGIVMRELWRLRSRVPSKPYGHA